MIQARYPAIFVTIFSIIWKLQLLGLKVQILKYSFLSEQGIKLWLSRQNNNKYTG